MEKTMYIKKYNVLTHKRKLSIKGKVEHDIEKEIKNSTRSALERKHKRKVKLINPIVIILHLIAFNWFVLSEAIKNADNINLSYTLFSVSAVLSAALIKTLKKSFAVSQKTYDY